MECDYTEGRKWPDAITGPAGSIGPRGPLGAPGSCPCCGQSGEGWIEHGHIDVHVCPKCGWNDFVASEINIGTQKSRAVGIERLLYLSYKIQEGKL